MVRCGFLVSDARQWSSGRKEMETVDGEPSLINVSLPIVRWQGSRPWSLTVTWPTLDEWKTWSVVEVQQCLD